MKTALLLAVVFVVALLFRAGTITNNTNAIFSNNDSLSLPADLEATVWAESPMFYNPTNIDIDIKGRIWVTEAVNYRDFNNDPKQNLSHPKGDRVMILEDTDADGVADTSTVFVQDKDLRSPLGIAVIGNKVIVSCSPSVIIYTDENGDDKPDKKEVFLTGFGGFDHDHGLHSFTAGPDGQWYFNTGNAGPHAVKDKAGWQLRSGSLYTGGTPYNLKNEPAQISDDGRIWVGGLALRIKPDGTGLKVMAHNFRNSYELALDSYGNMWQNDNDDQVITCRTSFVPEGSNAGYFSNDGSRYWQADQRPGQNTFTAHWHQEDPGVMPAGDNTGSGSPTGIVVYEGDELGKQYQGMLLSADAGRNVIFGYHPKIKGAGFQLDRTNFITSVKESTEGYKWDTKETDEKKWFRPSDVAVGPDGALYIADWYDPMVGGHAMKDKKGYGRIYRIAPRNQKLTVPKIDLGKTSGQLLALKSPAVNVRYSGFEKLRAEGAKALKDVKTLLRENNPYHRARAIWLIVNLGAEGVDVVEKLLANKNDDIRLTAFRALKSIKKEILPYAVRVSKDPSAAVRREAAIALRDIPYEKCKNTLFTLIEQYEGNDPWYLSALTSALDGKEENIYPELTRKYGTNPLKWENKIADIICSIHPQAAAQDLYKRAGASSLSKEMRRKSIVALGFIKTPQAAKNMAMLAAETSLPDVAGQGKWWIKYRKTNDWADFKIKGEENNIAEDLTPQTQQLMHKLLNEKLPLNARKQAAITLANDAQGAKALLSLAADKKIPASLNASIGSAIFNNPDQSVRVLAADYFEQPGQRKKYDISAIAQLNGEEKNGKLLFVSACSTCHKMAGQGNTIGPDLTNIKDKFDKNTLLDAIINPNASVVFGYEPWLITTKNGNTVYGFLQSSGKTVVLKDAIGKEHVIKAEDIASRKKTNTLMPDPETLKLNQRQLADIVAYLQQVKGSSSQE